ncbi:IclR family transcriptional regulator [Roseibium aestuarii]|uniref:IclR family transcriptional regulator n=1 Tax=Roseibium aestuarii TaxID=2600299 RepID=A0ABW4JV64_9HYPH|nr:IclR family transcriptional regulator [Roseibium aestuarii]
MSDFENDRRFATTLARGLSVLRAFRVSDNGLGNAEIAERTGLPKSTVSRLTFTLQALGYLSHARRHDRYRPGPALLALGNIASAAISFVDLSETLMQRLADDTGTMALLAVQDQDRMMLVKTWRPRTVASIWLEIGHRLPINGSSSGHALMASLSEEGFDRLYAEIASDELPRERAIEMRRKANGQLMSRGFVIADPADYFSRNVNAVSVPFYARDLSEPVIFTCGATPEDLTMERMISEVGPKLKTAVRELERMMGQAPSGAGGL